MWSDNETLSDCIDYTHLVGAVKSIIDNRSLLPCSIGIYGDWGSGKSSLMRMVEKQYEQQDDTLVIKFNGWLFEGYEDAKTVLMGRIVDEIIAKRSLGQKAIKAAAKLLKRIDILKAGMALGKYAIATAVAGPAGLAAVGSLDILKRIADTDYEKYITSKKAGEDAEEAYRSNIQDFHSNFNELIEESGLKKVIVFIDDLDRCSPDTIIGTLEAIKLFLFTKHTAFVIGADERLIKYAVRRRFPEIPGDNTEVGRDYLEKLIQYPIRIPPLNAMELTTYINLLFAELHTDAGEYDLVREKIMQRKNEQGGYEFMFDGNNASQMLNKVPNELKESLSLSAQIIPVLTGGLNGNPRQSKRFLNTLLLRHQMAASKGIELNKRILAKLMMLEYFKPETFNSLNRLQVAENGQIPALEKVEQQANGKEVDGKTLGEFDVYLKDEWLKSWFASEPSLVGQSLQPYYFFSRDKLSVIGFSLQRMSAQAQEYFQKLMSESKAKQKNALDNAAALSPSDAAAIFEALAQKVREKPEGDLLQHLFAFCKPRIDLLSQLLAFLQSLPVNQIPIVSITLLQDVAASTTFRAVAYDLVKSWSENSDNKVLARISKQKLNDFS